MMTVKEMSRLTGVSVRTLQYYDRIGLLRPAAHTEASYRLYDDRALERMQQILLFRELRFPLRQIGEILDSPGFDRTTALLQQKKLLELEKERLEAILRLTETMLTKGEPIMDFKPFDREKQRAYEQQAKARWGRSDAWEEYEKKSSGRTDAQADAITREFMEIFARFGAMREENPASPEPQKLVQTLQSFITAHYYTCTPQILRGLGQMYAAGGEMTDNIDRTGGPGTAAFTAAAIERYCR